MKNKLIHRIAIVFASLLLAATVGAQSKSRTYTIVTSESSFWVFVEKTGLLSGLAHDHEIGVKSFAGRVVVPEAGGEDMFSRAGVAAE